MKYNVLAIEREYASGGSEIGKKLAGRLGIPFYGAEITEMAAKKMGVTVKQLEKIEETMTGSLLYSLFAMGNFYSGNNSGLTTAQKLSLVESEIIKDLIQKGPCIIVGRSSAGLLKDNPRVMGVFIHADYAVRKHRAQTVYGINAADAALSEIDKRRAGYFKSTTGKDWQSPDCYHMIMDSGKLGIDTAVDILQSCMTDSGK